MSRLVLVANARMPSQRAQSLQVLHAAAAFAHKGWPTTVLYAKRADTPEISRQALLAHYGIDPNLEVFPWALPCLDWIDRMPRKAQFVPARLQEWTFARRAARTLQREYPGVRVLSREIETALALGSRPGVFLEIHRVPGGKLRRKWCLGACAQAAGVIAISGGVREDLVALGVDPARILVEHDAFDRARFAGVPDRAAARAQLALAGDEPLVVYTGGLLGWKGVEILLEAARRLPKVRFVIAGGMDADVARLRPLAAKLQNVRMDGFQPPERIPLYLAAGDLGVVPNRSQPAISARYTSPLKVFEAMALALPLVVSDLPSLRDILGPEEAVFVAPDDSLALAAGIERLVSDPGLSQNLGRNLSRRAETHTFEARAERILAWMDAAPA